MASEPTSTEESNMSQSGPRNFYCHQCNSRTRISIEVRIDPDNILFCNWQFVVHLHHEFALFTVYFLCLGIHMLILWLWVH